MAQHAWIICAGLYSSGSTWVFNVAAEIERLTAPTRTVAAIYGETLDDRLEREAAGADTIVLKTHMPDAAMRLVASRTPVPVIVSIRHPSDSVASLMQRFSLSFNDATAMVGKSCDAILRLVSVCRPLILKYEDRFTAGRDGIDRVAAHLGRTLSEDEPRLLSERLSSETVAAFIAQLTADGYFDSRPFANQCHPETQWHPNHVGDGVIGKYPLVLTGEQITLVGERTGEFRTHFGYGSQDG